MIWGNCWLVCNIKIRKSGWVKGGQNCWGMYERNSIIKQEYREGYFSFMDEYSICNPQGGMEEVCRVVIDAHDPVG